ncbi:hypothetical protein NQZ68_012334 [Dissostichus eleginoides]|nr:hypothetical protein NQZ68_012334 [Dissostichus eleginoides]
MCSGLLQSPLLGYICDGDQSSVGKETLLDWRQGGNVSMLIQPEVRMRLWVDSKALKSGEQGAARERQPTNFSQCREQAVYYGSAGTLSPG